MNSKQRTKILYDDPNSFLRASRTVNLHELSGATLKTTKPTTMDVKMGMITSSKIIELINNLDAIDTRINWVNLNLGIDMYYAQVEGTLREIVKFAGLSQQNLRALKKSSQISADDLIAISNLQSSISDSLEWLDNIDFNPDDMGPQAYDDVQRLVNGTTYTKVIQSIDKLRRDLFDFVNVKNSSTQTPIGTLPGDLQPEPYLEEDIPGPPPGNPDDEDGLQYYDALQGMGRYRGGSLGAQSGHFRVLSNRASKIQSSPFKRFL